MWFLMGMASNTKSSIISSWTLQARSANQNGSSNKLTICIRLSIQIPSHSRCFVCPTRKLELEIFGAVCALMMIEGADAGTHRPVYYPIHHSRTRHVITPRRLRW